MQEKHMRIFFKSQTYVIIRKQTKVFYTKLYTGGHKDKLDTKINGFRTWLFLVV